MKVIFIWMENRSTVNVLRSCLLMICGSTSWTDTPQMDLPPAKLIASSFAWGLFPARSTKQTKLSVKWFVTASSSTVKITQRKTFILSWLTLMSQRKMCSRLSINLKLKASTTSYAYRTGLYSSMAFLLLCLSSRARSKRIQRSWTPILSSPCVIAVIFPNSSSITPSS